MSPAPTQRFTPEMQADLGALGPAVAARLDRMDAEDVVARIWRHDHTVWKPDPTEITNRLGWLDEAAREQAKVPVLRAFAGGAAADGISTAVLLGMGGSSLAPEMFARTYGKARGAVELKVLDTTHPARIATVEKSLDALRCLWVVASKSGGTLETRSHMEHFYNGLGHKQGSRFVAITDPGSSLETVARDRGFRAVYQANPEIGGRYSALSLFGLVNAALLGVDLEMLLGAAEGLASSSAPVTSAWDAPGAWLGAVIGEATLAGRDKLTFVLPGSVAAFGDWVEQLVAESSGKEGKGIVPVPGEDLGAPEAYAPDRLFVALGDHPGLAALRSAAHPVVTLGFAGPEQLGAEIFRFEFATAVACSILGVNAFDQPNVEEAKQATRDILAAGGAKAADPPEPGDAAALLGALQPGDYVAIQAYLDPEPATAAALQGVRMAIRDRHRVATTVGFGPRFLHSTGQLHKGGPNTGVFLQVVDPERPVDIPIPGQTFTFGDLIDAQALGDLQALRARGRRVARLTPDELKSLV